MFLLIHYVGIFNLREMIKVEIGNTRSYRSARAIIESSSNTTERTSQKNINLDKIEDHIACRSVCKYCVRIYIYIYLKYNTIIKTNGYR